MPAPQRIPIYIIFFCGWTFTSICLHIHHIKNHNKKPTTLRTINTLFFPSKNTSMKKAKLTHPICMLPPHKHDSSFVLNHFCRPFVEEKKTVDSDFFLNKFCVRHAFDRSRTFKAFLINKFKRIWITMWFLWSSVIIAFQTEALNHRHAIGVYICVVWINSCKTFLLVKLTLTTLDIMSKHLRATFASVISS